MGDRVRVVALLTMVLVSAWPAWAAEPVAEAEERKGSVLLPLPIVFYSPETKLAAGATASWLYRTSPQDAESRPSRISGVGIYTVRNQLLLALGGEHYLPGERHRISGGVSYKKFPDQFYDLGNDNAADDSDSYTDEGFLVEVEYAMQVRPSVWLGGGLVFGESSITDVEAGERLRDPDIPGAAGAKALGAALAASYDTRSSVTYPRSGALYEVRAKFFGEVLGADHRFSTVSLDSRHYRELFGATVLAVRGLGMLSEGDVPFQLMPALGGDQLLRGYFGGRFRDRNLVAAQAEFRGLAWRRLGYALFGGLGQVASDPDGFGSDRFHASAGFGLRILLVPEESVNLRLDFGFGEDESGFYLAFGEVF